MAGVADGEVPDACGCLPPADDRYANFVALVAGALADSVAVPQDVLALLAKLAAGFRADLELQRRVDADRVSISVDETIAKIFRNS